jgi:hypothetical protein
MVLLAQQLLKISQDWPVAESGQRFPQRCGRLMNKPRTKAAIIETIPNKLELGPPVRAILGRQMSTMPAQNRPESASAKRKRVVLPLPVIRALPPRLAIWRIGYAELGAMKRQPLLPRRDGQGASMINNI